jgi:hypothetical protein
MNIHEEIRKFPAHDSTDPDEWLAWAESQKQPNDYSLRFLRDWHHRDDTLRAALEQYRAHPNLRIDRQLVFPTASISEVIGEIIPRLSRGTPGGSVFLDGGNHRFMWGQDGKRLPVLFIADQTPDGQYTTQRYKGPPISTRITDTRTCEIRTWLRGWYCAVTDRLRDALNADNFGDSSLEIIVRPDGTVLHLKGDLGFGEFPLAADN